MSGNLFWDGLHDGVLRDHAHDAIVEAVERNWRASVKAFGLAPTTTIHEDEELFWYVTGVPVAAFNSLMHASLAPDRIDAAVAELYALRARYGVPMDWLVGPISRPKDLPAQLQARGLRHLVDLTPMTLDLTSPLEDGRPVPGLTVERVEDTAALDAWIAAEGRGFEMEEPIRSQFAALRRAMGIGHGLPLHHYLGRLAGQPVATASLMLAGGIAGIYDVSTDPEARHRGVGAAMTLAALREARTLGYEIAFLQPSAMGKPMYRRLGFEERCVCGVYG